MKWFWIGNRMSIWLGISHFEDTLIDGMDEVNKVDSKVLYSPYMCSQFLQLDEDIFGIKFLLETKIKQGKKRKICFFEKHGNLG